MPPSPTQQLDVEAPSLVGGEQRARRWRVRSGRWSHSDPTLAGDDDELSGVERDVVAVMHAARIIGVDERVEIGEIIGRTDGLPVDAGPVRRRASPPPDVAVAKAARRNGPAQPEIATDRNRHRRSFRRADDSMCCRADSPASRRTTPHWRRAVGAIAPAPQPRSTPKGSTWDLRPVGTPQSPRGRRDAASFIARSPRSIPVPDFWEGGGVLNLKPGGNCPQ